MVFPFSDLDEYNLDRRLSYINIHFVFFTSDLEVYKQKLSANNMSVVLILAN